MIRIFCENDCEFYSPIADEVYKFLGISGRCSIELVLSTGEEIRELNKKHRNIDRETDVLSFPSISFYEGIKRLDKKNYPLEYDKESSTVDLGSIVINEQRAKLQAEEYGHSFEREKAYLFLHGLLHVFGYDHIENEERRIMRQIEEKILNKFGLNISEEKE